MCLVHKLGLAEAVGVDWSSPVTALHECRMPALDYLVYQVLHPLRRVSDKADTWLYRS